MDSVIPSAPAKSTKVDFDWADPFGLDNQLSSEDNWLSRANGSAQSKSTFVDFAGADGITLSIFFILFH